jgi:hypothetical protein
MNPLNFFKFLEKQKGIPIPLKVKLIQGLPITSEDLDVKGNLDIINTSITSFPQGLQVKKNLLAAGTEITSLPKNLKVGGDLVLGLCYNLTSLPQGLQVGGSLALEETSITSLPPDLKVEKNLWIEGTPLAKKSDEEIRTMLTTGYIKGGIKR